MTTGGGTGSSLSVIFPVTYEESLILSSSASAGALAQETGTSRATTSNNPIITISIRFILTSSR
jgi:hypothetical protein